MTDRRFKVKVGDEVRAIVHNPCPAMVKRLEEQGLTLEEGVEELPDRRSLENRMDAVKAKRNAKLSEFEWTISAASPLSPANRAEWLLYLRDLHKVTKDLDDPDLVVWPTEPELRYAVT